MDEPGNRNSGWRIWLKRAGIALAVLVLLLALFHRPILQTVVRRVALSFAEKQNLKLDFRVEGSVIGGIELHNVHAVATGPSALQSLDADLVRVDYSLPGFLRGGMASLLEDVEVRNANIVLDPAKAPPAVEPQESTQQFTVPAFFPEAMTLSNVNVRVKSQPEDMILEGLNLDLNANRPGELRIAKLQLSSGRTWSDVSGQTTYENRNLYIRNLVLDEQSRIDELNIDASKVGEKKIGVGLRGTIAGGKIDTSMSLGEKEDTATIDLNVEETSIGAVRNYLEPGGGAGGSFGADNRSAAPASPDVSPPATAPSAPPAPGSFATAAPSDSDSAEGDLPAAAAPPASPSAGRRDAARTDNSVAAASRGRDVATAGGDADAARPSGAGASPSSGQEGGLIPEGIDGDVKKLSIKGSGKPGQPSSWEGSISARLENLSASGLTFDTVNLDASAADGQANIQTLNLTRGENTISVEGTAQLPDSMSQFGQVPANLQLRANVPELGSLTSAMPHPIEGPAEVNGRIRVEDSTLLLDLAAVAGPLEFEGGSLQRAVVKLNAARKMPPKSADDDARAAMPFYENLRTDLTAQVQDLRYTDYIIDSIDAATRSDGKQFAVEKLAAIRGENRLDLQATYELPRDFSNAANQPGSVDLHFAAPALGQFWVEGAESRIEGSIELYAQTRLGPELGGGSFQLYGKNISARDLTIPEVSAAGTIASDVVYLNDLTVEIAEEGFVRAHGQSGVEKPFAFSGALEVNIASLEKLEPLLASAGTNADLAGALSMHWRGSGSLENLLQSGEIDLTLENGRYGELDDLEAKVQASYSPEALNVPIVYVSSDKLLFQTIMQARDGALEMTKIQIVQGESKYADGYVRIPFAWEHIGTGKPLVPPGGKVLINFQTKALDIDKLAKNLGTEAPVSGLADLKLEAEGAIDDLRATLDLELTGLRSDELKEFRPATFSLKAQLENERLVVDGSLNQAQIQPVQIKASVPLDVAKVIEQKKIADSTPLEATVRMERSSINFVRQFVPAIERIDGNLALNVDVAGTIANPRLSGAADIRINATRLDNEMLPSISNFDARISFDNDRVTFQQFRGELAGGPFTLSGQITFPKLTEPRLDLRLRADAILVARTDDLTARTDANITIEGPYDSATVTGDVALTNSKFLNNIELIPIGLPNRPPPAPQPPAERQALAFPDPPLRDWKFNVSIRTKDPFRIRGNLANGAAIVNMKLGGTGANPIIDGSVRLQNMEATLPFSRLEITNGFIYFNPGDPFNPGLDLQGVSVIRDYTVRVYIYGTLDEPEAVFTSEPPLPQEEIIALIATGTTREELASGGNVLAGRALLLLGQQLYQKIFKKGQGDNTNDFLDRLQVDIGGVDPRTGQQTATARYRATDRIQVIGEIGLQGDFRTRLKYLIRFR